MIGVNSGVMGLAAVGGSLVAAAVAHRMRRRPVFFVAGAPRFLILAVDAPVWADPGALGDSVGYVGIPLGGLLAGAAVAWAGPAAVLVVCGVTYFLTTNLTALRPEWREMDRLRGRGRPAVPEGAGTAG